MKTKLTLIGTEHWKRERKALEAMGFELVRYSKFINGKPRWAELRRKAA